MKIEELNKEHPLDDKQISIVKKSNKKSVIKYKENSKAKPEIQ